jgi:hypothetical protein
MDLSNSLTVEVRAYSLFVLPKLIKGARKMNNWIKRNSVTILTVTGAVGVVATTVMAIKATPKALKVLEEAEKEKGEELTRMEKVVVAAPSYIPTIVTGTASIVCILSANVLNKRSQAAITSAYALLDSSYKEYKNKVKDLYGEDASDLVREEIAKDHYDESDIPDEEPDTKLFFDEFSKRYFRATTETVLRAEYEMNRILNETGGACLNDYYYLVGLDSVDYGEYLGWSAAQMYEMYWESWLYFNHTKTTTEDGTELWIIDFTEPFPEYDEY